MEVGSTLGHPLALLTPLAKEEGEGGGVARPLRVLVPKACDGVAVGLTDDPPPPPLLLVMHMEGEGEREAGTVGERGLGVPEPLPPPLPVTQAVAVAEEEKVTVDVEDMPGVREETPPLPVGDEECDPEEEGVPPTKVGVMEKVEDRDSVVVKQGMGVAVGGMGEGVTDTDPLLVPPPPPMMSVAVGARKVGVERWGVAVPPPLAVGASNGVNVEVGVGA